MFKVRILRLPGGLAVKTSGSANASVSKGDKPQCTARILGLVAATLLEVSRSGGTEENLCSNEQTLGDARTQLFGE